MIDSKSIEENNIATTQNSYQPPAISYTQYTQPIKQENVCLGTAAEDLSITRKKSEEPSEQKKIPHRRNGTGLDFSPLRRRLRHP